VYFNLALQLRVVFDLQTHPAGFGANRDGPPTRPTQEIRIMLSHLLSQTLNTLRDRKGVTAAEYAVLAAAIVGVVALAAASLGTEITNKFANIMS
jgi:pilus assembly protein Flp/PilA